MENRGQLSVDYLITVILLGIIALVVFTAFDSNERYAFDTMERIYMRDIADGLVKGVSDVMVMGDGSYKEIYLPNSTIRGRSYNVTIFNNLVLVRWGNSDFASRLPASNFNETEILVDHGNLVVWNTNETLYIATQEEWEDL